LGIPLRLSGVFHLTAKVLSGEKHLTSAKGIWNKELGILRLSGVFT